MNSIYRENIMDHYKNPRNEGELEDATHIHEEDNPLCGDKQKWFIQLAKDSSINDIKFTGDGCAISLASASMLSEEIQNMKIDDILKLDEKYMMNLIGVKVGPGRLKCLMLPLSAIKKALHT